MAESKNACRVLVGRPEGRRPLQRLGHKWEDNIKMDSQEVGWGGMGGIDIAQYMDGWGGAVVNAVMNLGVP
jgi:hypothetical protein